MVKATKAPKKSINVQSIKTNKINPSISSSCRLSSKLQVNNMTPTMIVVKLLLLQTATTPLEEFISRHFFERTLVVVTSNVANMDPKLTFILNLIQPKLITTPKNIPNFQRFKHYIITESNVNRLSSSVNLLKDSINTRGQFLVIIQNNTTESDIKSLLMEMLHFYIYNVVIYANWSTFLTWYPYNSENHCGTTINIVKSKLNPFDNKLPTHLNRCPIVVPWNRIRLAVKTPFNKTDPGHGIRVIDTIGEKLNATIIYTENNELVENSVNEYMTFALAAGSKRRFVGSPLDISFFYVESYCFFVLPPRRKITSSASTLVVFSKQIWTMLSVSVVLMTILWRHMTKLPLRTCCFQITRLLLQGTLRRMYLYSTFNRLVCGMFLLYTLFLNWIYVSQLSGILSKPSYEPKITTIGELASSNKKLELSGVWERFLSADIKYKDLVKKQIKLNFTSVDEQIKHFVQQPDYGLILTHNRLMFIKNFEQLELLTQEKVRYIHVKLL